MTPHELSRTLEAIYAGNLESVILYGSAATGDFSKKFSDYNIIVVLKDASPGELAKVGKLVRRWTRKGSPSPLFFDHDHVKTSRDVFPLEFTDIRDRHRVLFGADPFANIAVDSKNLRHQCESELKGKILHLRSYYALNCHRPARIAHMMATTFPQFTAIFRGILRLLDAPVPGTSGELIEELSQRINFNPTVFLDIISARDGNRSLPRHNEALQAFEDYLTALGTIARFVDLFEG